MPFHSSSIQDRIMDSEPSRLSSLFPFTTNSNPTSRFPPAQPPSHIPPPHSNLELDRTKTKWSQQWLSTTYPSVWSASKSKERKSSDPPATTRMRNESVDEGLLSQVVELELEEERGKWGGSGREKQRRVRQMMEIGALFGMGLLLVGLVIVCISAGGMMRRAAVGRERLPNPVV